MKEVLIVIMHLEMGGAEKSLVNFLNELKEEDAKIDLLLFKKKGILLDEIPKWINIIDPPKEIDALYRKIPKNISQIPYFLVRIFCTIYSKIYSKFTGITAKNIRWTKFYSKIISRVEKIYDTAISYINGECTDFIVDKVEAKTKVGWIHTDYSKIVKRPEEDDYYFSKLNYIVTISDTCVESIVNKHPDIKNKVVCLPNIVSSQLIRRKAHEFFPEEIKNKKNIIVSVGRLEHVKGFDLAVEAAKLLNDRNIEFKWIIIGEGSQHKKLNELIRKYNLKDRIALLGLKINPYPYIANCDIIVQPSRFEGKSIALDEAKILNKPIIATNYSTVRDQLNEKEGCIVGMNANEIADEVEKMLFEPGLINNIKKYLKENEYGNSEIIKDYKKYINVREENDI